MLVEYEVALLTDIFQSYINLIGAKNQLGENLENTIVFAYEGSLQGFREGLWDVIISTVNKFGIDFEKINVRVSKWAENSARLAEEYQSLKARGLIH